MRRIYQDDKTREEFILDLDKIARVRVVPVKFCGLMVG